MSGVRSKPKSRVAKKGTKRSSRAKASAGGAWRMSDLPLDLQVELRDRIAQAERGEDLHDFDEAMAEAERISDEMLAVLNRDPRRPAG